MGMEHLSTERQETDGSTVGAWKSAVEHVRHP